MNTSGHGESCGMLGDAAQTCLFAHLSAPGGHRGRGALLHARAMAPPSASLFLLIFVGERWRGIWRGRAETMKTRVEETIIIMALK